MILFGWLDPVNEGALILQTAGSTCPTTQHHIPEDWNLLLASAVCAKNLVLMNQI